MKVKYVDQMKKNEKLYMTALYKRVSENVFCRLFEAKPCKSCGHEGHYSVKETSDGLKIVAYFICPECGRKYKMVAVDFSTTPTSYHMNQYLVCCFRGKNGVYHGVYRDKNTIDVILPDSVKRYPEEKLKLIGREDGLKEMEKAANGGKNKNTKK